jgi:hypothetical protein
MDFGFAQTALQTVAQYYNSLVKATNYYTTQSLSEASKMTRVEPLTIVSKDLLNNEIMPDVASTALNVFSGHYLQAIAVMTKVKDVEVVKILDRLNPDRDATGFLLAESLSQESIATVVASNYTHSLPIRGVAMENTDDKTLLQDVNNLAVGKLLNVDISFKTEADESKTIKLPISVRLATTVVPNSTIRGLLAHTKEDISIVERFHAWRSGRIEFIRDLIFCQDLIDEQKKAAIEDDTGTAAEIMRRVANSKKYGLLSKNPSLASASNIFIFSEEVKREIESKLGGPLANHRTREKAFDNTYAMLLIVVDREWERVTFYTRGMNASMDMSFKEIKAAGKGKGPDIGDILKAFQMGAPAF